MAGGLKKSNIKKKSQRAELMAEEKRIEQEKEQAKKDAAIRKKKNYNKNAIDTMVHFYQSCSTRLVFFHLLHLCLDF